MLSWWERRGGMWDSFDSNRRISYYKFLRAVYHMTATEAWDRAKGTMVIGPVREVILQRRGEAFAP